MHSGISSCSKSTQITSDAYWIKWVEQVRIQALGTDMAVCILNFAPVPWQRETVSTERVCDTFNDKWTVKGAQSLRQ